jgi:hypothetical protein
MSSHVRVEIRISSSWDRIEPVRRAVASCVGAIFDDEDLRDSLSMAVAELLENAVKYGDPADPAVTVTVGAAADTVEVSVSNAVGSAADVTRLFAMLEELDDGKSAAHKYIAALEASSGRARRSSGASGIGILRIAYEGGFALACDTALPGRLTVHAERRIPR